MLEFINFYFIPGLVLGAIYTLGAIGVSLLFGILRFAHFAHGDLMTLGAYLALTLVVWLGFPVLLALPFAMVFTWTGRSTGRSATARPSSWSSPRSAWR